MDCFSLQGKDTASKGAKCSKFLPAIAAFCWSLAPLDRCKARIQLHAAWWLWWGSHRGLEAAGWPGLGCEHVLSWGSLYRVTKSTAGAWQGDAALQVLLHPTPWQCMLWDKCWWVWG